MFQNFGTYENAKTEVPLLLFCISTIAFICNFRKGKTEDSGLLMNLPVMCTVILCCQKE